MPVRNSNAQIPGRFTSGDPRIVKIPESGCWIWMRQLDKGGYGHTSPKKGTRVSAHRAFFQEANGPILPGMYLDHVCRVRCCVNPDHLRVVTPRQNSLENSVSLPAVYTSRTACPKCGGPWSHSSRQRICKPCKLDYSMEYKRRKNGVRPEKFRGPRHRKSVITTVDSAAP